MHQYLAIVLAVLIASTALAEEIPLKSIWAYNMPGTQDLRKLPSVKSNQEVIETIRKALLPKLDAKLAQRGFAVSGDADEALSQARGILVDGKDAPSRFSADDEIYGVFFAYQSPFYIQIDKVERKGAGIRVSYQFVPHESGETTEHFALIPFGKLPPGKYSVRVEQSPQDKKYTDLGFPPLPSSAGQQQVSRTYHFVVAK